MAKQGQKHELIRAYVGTAWTPERARAVQQGVRRKVNRRRNHVRIAGALGLAGLVAGGWWARGDWVDVKEASTLELAANDAQSVLALGDGSYVYATHPNTNVRDLLGRVQTTSDDVTIQMVAAGARFEIRGPRAFAVNVREISVQVLAATFVIAQLEGQMAVEVENGEARVLWPQGQTTVKAGQRFLVPLDEGASAAKAERREKAPKPASARWQSLAQRGRFDEAFVALQDAIVAQGRRAVPDEPGALLLAADAARLSHHPEQALPHLQRFVNQFVRDPRASMAAFTMGLVLLEELGRPREAARAFAQSRALAPQGDLAEDALARQAEASFRAGDPERAQSAAHDYLQHFPNGRRVRAVKRFGAIE